MKLALLVDFDGTVTEKDVGVMLLEAFATEEWRRFASIPHSKPRKGLSEA